MFEPLDSSLGNRKLDNILTSKAAKLKLNQGSYSDLLSIPTAHRKNGLYKRNISKSSNDNNSKTHSYNPQNFENINVFNGQSQNQNSYDSLKCRCESASLLNSSSKTEIIFPKDKLIVTRSVSQGIRTKNKFIRKHIKLKTNRIKKEEFSKKEEQKVVVKIFENKNIKSIRETVCIDNLESFKNEAADDHDKQTVFKNDSIQIKIEDESPEGILSHESELLQVPMCMQRLVHLQSFHESIQVDHQADKYSDSSINSNSEIFKDSDELLELKHYKKYPNVCLPKNMRQKSEHSFLSNRIKSCSSDDGGILHSDQTNEALIKCGWLGCKHHYRCKDKLTKHVKKEHLMPASKNEVFNCLWRDCKYFDQPSCSFRWLSRHLLSHCDEKPFKCVIQGCDLAFRSQEGLAKHVPTHFNERQVRRACVMTSRNQNTFVTPAKNSVSRSLSSSPQVVSSSNLSTPTSQCGSEATNDEPSIEESVAHYYQVSTYPNRIFKQIQNKLSSSSSTIESFNGYSGSDFNISHVVSGKRTSADGKTEFSLATPFAKSYLSQSFWIRDSDIRKRKNLHVSIPCSRMSNDMKAFLYDRDHSSRRRKKRRK